MPPKKSRAAKSGLNYESLIHYMRYETYPKYVVSEHEKRNIRKRSKSFRLQGCAEGDKLFFVYSDDGQVKQEKEVIYTHEDQQRVFDEFHINEKGSPSNQVIKSRYILTVSYFSLIYKKCMVTNMLSGVCL